VTGAIELPGRHRVDQPREQPGPWARHPPPVAQQLKQLRREHDIAILVTLALLDAQRHPLAVNVEHLQRDDLGHAQACAIGDAERRLVFDAGGGLQKSRHFLGAQYDRRLARFAHERQTPDQIVPFERQTQRILNASLFAIAV